MFNNREETMKWSQAICASILIDELFPVPQTSGPKPRFAPALRVTPLEPLSARPLLAPDWGLAPEAIPVLAPEQDSGGQAPSV